MSMWVLHQRLTPDEEAHIFERTHLNLPFEGLPDLSQVANQGQALQLLRMLHPDEPPESLTLRMDRFWHIFSNLQAEDIIVVPLPSMKEVVLAEVAGGYQYDVGDKGSDIHLIPVKWHTVRVPASRFNKHKEVFSSYGQPMYEIIAQETRVAVRDQLPHKYNRFARWKWLFALLFALGMLRVALRF